MSGFGLRMILVGLAVAQGAPGARAQAPPVPNVNDCTFIRDPTALRDCIELYEGQRLAPGPRSAAFQPAPITDPALLDAAGPIPGSYAARRGRRQARREAARARAAKARTVSDRAPSNDVRIKQVEPAQ